MKFYCDRLLYELEDIVCIKQQDIMWKVKESDKMISDYCGRCLDCPQGMRIKKKLEDKNILKEKAKEVAENKVKEILINIASKVCKKCGKKLPLTDFRKDNECKDGYRLSCKKCNKK